MNHVKCYKKNYPRPSFVRDSYINLNGEWDFAFDDEFLGEKQGWYNGKDFDKKINVPFSYTCDLSGVEDKSRHDCVWYKKQLDITSSSIGKNELYLNFEGSDYHTKVWVNGKFVGEHKGGYARFSFEISKLLNNKKNVVVVEVKDSFDTSFGRGKQRWQKDSFACFYVETTGIWKDVWLEIVNPVSLKNVMITPDIDKSSVKFDYEVNGDFSGCTLKTTVSFGDMVIASSDAQITRNNFSQEYSVISEACFFKVFAWHALCPQLYDVAFEIIKDGKVIDKVGSYFGMRKVSAKNRVFDINNRPEFLKMVLDQGYFEGGNMTSPSEESLQKDVELMKYLGFNGVRKHQKIEDDRFYYYCDVMGLFAWCEMPSAYEYTPSGTQAFTEEWMEIIRQHYNHPSIICWVPFNESWGVFDIYASQKQQAFTQALYYLTKSYDSTRMVISNDGWEHTKSDIITLHNYVETGKEIVDCYGDLTKTLSDNHATTKLPKHAFANGFEYEGQPIMITEYGGVAFVKDKGNGWGYGKMVQDDDEFLSRLEDLTETIRNLDGVSGYCITQLTDVQQEVNGLLTYDRKSKVQDFERMCNIFRK